LQIIVSMDGNRADPPLGVYGTMSLTPHKLIIGYTKA